MNIYRNIKPTKSVSLSPHFDLFRITAVFFFYSTENPDSFKTRVFFRSQSKHCIDRSTCKLHVPTLYPKTANSAADHVCNALIPLPIRCFIGKCGLRQTGLQIIAFPVYNSGELTDICGLDKTRKSYWDLNFEGGFSAFSLSSHILLGALRRE